MTKGEIVITIR